MNYAFFIVALRGAILNYALLWFLIMHYALRICIVFVVFADFSTADFAVDSLWQFVDQLYDARVLVWCGEGLDEVLDVLLDTFARLAIDIVVVFRLDDDGGLDELSAYVVRDGRDGALLTCRVLHEH